MHKKLIKREKNTIFDKMRTTLGINFDQEIEMGVRARKKIEKREDLFLCQCANALLCKKQSRVGMLHLSVMPFNMIKKTYYNTTGSKLETIAQEVSNNEKHDSCNKKYKDYDVKPKDNYKIINVTIEPSEKDTKTQQMQVKRGKVAAVCNAKQKEPNDNYCTTLSQEEKKGQSNREKLKEERLNVTLKEESKEKRNQLHY